MSSVILYPVGTTDACSYAAAFLEQAGIPMIDHPSPDITHVLLDVPSFDKQGLLRDGSDLRAILCMLPNTVKLIGGNLDRDYLKHYQTMDLLKDSSYLASNAAITAECALQAAASHLKTTFSDTPALILGWGRIGKCLSKKLSALGCPVTVAARKAHDRAILSALDYKAIDFGEITTELKHFRLLFNTVPEPPYREDMLDSWNNGVAIDLASDPGMPGASVIPARGLPGKYAPESSGKLIAESILRHFREEQI